MTTLFWVQESCVAVEKGDLKVFSFQARETAKTFVAEEKSLASFRLKVINKSLVGVRFFFSEREALEAKIKNLQHRIRDCNNAYCTDQIKRAESMLAQLKT